MSHLDIPNCGQRLHVGDIVILERFPDIKWVLQNGWYSCDNRPLNGWYFASIPAHNCIPVEESDLINIVVVSSNYIKPGCYPQPPCPPKPSPCPSSYPAYRPVEPYRQGISYLPSQLLYLTPGELYQVVDRFTSSNASVFVADSLKADVDAGHLAPVGSGSGGGGSPTSASNCYGVKFMEVFQTDSPTITQTNAYLASISVTPASGIMFINTDAASSTYLSMLIYTEVKSGGTTSLILTQPMGEYYSKSEIDTKIDEKVTAEVDSQLTTTIDQKITQEVESKFTEDIDAIVTDILDEKLVYATESELPEY